MKRDNVLTKEVSYQHHGLDGAYGGFIEVRGHAEGLMSRGDVEFSRLLPFFRGGCGYELGSHSKHREDHCYKRPIAAILFRLWESPEVFVVGVEGLPVYHGVDGIDAFEVAVEEDVGLDFLWEDGDGFWEASLACPVVCKWVLGSDAEYV